MSEISVQTLLNTSTVSIRDVQCRGSCHHKSAAECAEATHIVFPYRGLYVRHVGRDEAVADANQALFFNAGQEYQVSHPVSGGDACLSMEVAPSSLFEIVPREFLQAADTPVFKQQRKIIDSRAQVLVALIRHALRSGVAEPLEAETLMLTLVRRTLGVTPSNTKASHGRQKLVDRAKLVLASDPARRWTLADVAAETGGSAVYLTQVFQQVEGMPLYRYQTQLRLARALDLIDQYEDLSALSFDLGFSSHSHFSKAFRQAYGRSPSEFKDASIRR